MTTGHPCTLHASRGSSRERDLHFAGVVPLHQNFRDTAVPEALEKVFADATDRLTFESLKDFAINEFFRRDVYVKGRTSRHAAAL